MEILKHLQVLHGMTDYLGAGVFSPDGQMLGGVTEVLGMSFEIAGAIFHDAFTILDNNAREVGFGHMDLVQVNTEKAIVFGKCCQEGEVHFHVIMALKPEANIAMAKIMLNKVVDSLKTEFI